MKINSTLLILIYSLITFSSCRNSSHNIGFGNGVLQLEVNIAAIDQDRIFEDANIYMTEEPITITTTYCKRSNGGKHDFYSEGDYWWPNPQNPNGPYIRKDGETNPETFTIHRKMMRRMSIQVATLTAAYMISGNEKYANKAVEHLTAWFVNEETRMNPNMNFAQAIKGVCSGRGIGIIDGIHLVEPARSITILEKSNSLNKNDLIIIKEWFAEFLEWMTTNEYGIDERDRKNNHGTCWVMQVAEFARLTENDQLLDYCRNRYKTVLLPNQMSSDGSFHMELQRTKPYAYSLFNIDAMAMVCHILSTPEENLWYYTLKGGEGMELGMKFIAPYIDNKTKWPLKPDIMYWNQWPVRQPSLLFAGLSLGKLNYIELWKKLEPIPKTEEGLRNFPIRQPLLWIEYKPYTQN